MAGEGYRALAAAKRKQGRIRKQTALGMEAISAVGTVAAFGATKAQESTTAWEDYEAGYEELTTSDEWDDTEYDPVEKRGGMFSKPKGEIRIGDKLYDREQIAKVGSFKGTLGETPAAMTKYDEVMQTYKDITLKPKDVPTEQLTAELRGRQEEAAKDFLSDPENVKKDGKEIFSQGFGIGDLDKSRQMLKDAGWTGGTTEYSKMGDRPLLSTGGKYAVQGLDERIETGTGGIGVAGQNYVTSDLASSRTGVYDQEAGIKFKAPDFVTPPKLDTYGSNITDEDRAETFNIQKAQLWPKESTSSLFKNIQTFLGPDQPHSLEMTAEEFAEYKHGQQFPETLELSPPTITTEFQALADKGSEILANRQDAQRKIKINERINLKEDKAYEEYRKTLVEQRGYLVDPNTDEIIEQIDSSTPYKDSVMDIYNLKNNY